MPKIVIEYPGQQSIEIEVETEEMANRVGQQLMDYYTQQYGVPRRIYKDMTMRQIIEWAITGKF